MPLLPSPILPQLRPPRHCEEPPCFPVVARYIFRHCFVRRKRLPRNDGKLEAGGVKRPVGEDKVCAGDACFWNTVSLFDEF